MVTSPKVLGSEKDYADKGQQYMQKTDPVLSSERAPQKNKTLTVKK
jgi:hypothetical protein